MKPALFVTAAIAAAVAVFTGFSLPPPRLALAGHDGDTVAGVLHVHTNRSDGQSSPEEVAAAAARVGLKFVVFTDHGDGTRPPDPPTYRAGVLCLDAIEISTSRGHYLALDMPSAPYPLGGDARDVIEDVRRLGGFGVAAHPDSPREELRWRDWSLPFDGVEIVNLDSSWRLHLAESGWRPTVRLLKAFLAYPLRARETIAGLVAVTPDTIREFDALTETRRVVALAGADAHARLALGNADPGAERFSLPFPGYETVFQTLAIHVRPERPLSRDAAADGRLVMQALRAGRLYTVVSGLASPSFFEFTAENGGGVGREGEVMAPGGPITLRVRSNAPPGFITTILQGGRVLISREGQEVVVATPGESGVFRAEVRTTGRSDASRWIISNPIFVWTRSSADIPAVPAPRARTLLFDGRDASRWRVETDPTSRAELDLADLVEGRTLRLRYGLSGGAPAGQFAALAVDTAGGVAPHERLMLTVRADRPMRMSVQARVAVSPTENERWQRSVYVDEVSRELAVVFDDMTPVGATRTPRPPPASVHSIVFVVELTNAKPGSSGRIWIREASLER